MAAWVHKNHWNASRIQGYRAYVATNAPLYEGRAEDCADLCLTLLIDFASANALPVTFWDTERVRYASKGTGQHPSPLFGALSWDDKEEYTAAVQRRIGAKALYRVNTKTNPSGPLPGDLMLKPDHAALVFAVYSPGQVNPQEADKSVGDFPGNSIARTQLKVTRYYRNRAVSLPDRRFDYLNHRGDGGKQAAELIYNASEHEMRADGFDFRIFGPGVFDNWLDWSGLGSPPR